MAKEETKQRPRKRKRTAKKRAAEAKPSALAERVLLATELLTQGYRYSQVREMIAQSRNVSVRTAERDLAKALESLVKEGEQERPAQKERIRQFLWGIARKAATGGKYKAATDAIRQLCKIDGIEAAQKLEHDFGGGVLIVPRAGQVEE